MKNFIKIFFISIFCLCLAKATPAQEQTWDELMTQVNTLYQQNNFVQAIETAKNAVKLAEKEFGPDKNEVALTLNTLAYLYFKQGKNAEAENLCKKSLGIVEKISPYSDETAAAFNNLAEIYVAEKKYSDAESLYKRSIDIVEKRLGPNDPYVGMVLESLAELYQTMGRLEEAKATLARAQQISEKENIE